MLKQQKGSCPISPGFTVHGFPGVEGSSPKCLLHAPVGPGAKGEGWAHVGEHVGTEGWAELV